MSIINPTLTKGNGRYLNKADFENTAGLFGYHMNQDLAAIGANLQRENIPTFLTDDTFNFVVSESLDFGTNGLTMLVNDHVGNYTRCGAFVNASNRTSNFGLTTEGDNLLFSTGLADFDDEFAISFWMRMRNTATGINNKGTVLNWNSGTANNGTQNGSIILWRNIAGNQLQYTAAGNLAFTTGPGTTATIAVPAVADWIHLTVVKTFSGNNGNGLFNIYVNGVKTEVTTVGNTSGGEWSNIGYNDAATALNDGSTFTFDLSEVWLTSVGSDGYNGTIWDDPQVLKMYQLGAGLFREPDFSTKTRENNAVYGSFTWVVPTGVTAINFTGAASGGGGGPGRSASNVGATRAASGGGGGGGGAFLFGESITVVPGETITFTVADGGAVSTAGTDLTIVGTLNGNASATVSLDGGKAGGTGLLNNGESGQSGGAGGAGGSAETANGETTTAGASGGAGGPTALTPTGGSVGSAGGNTTVDGSTVSGGSGGGANNNNRRRSGGGGGGASIATGGNGGNASTAAAAGNSGGGGGGGGFLSGVAGGNLSASAGGAGGFSFTYLLPKGSTDSPLVGP